MSKLQPLLSWRSAIAESDLAPGVRHVALTLSLHMNERGGSAFPTVATLCRETGLSENTVRTHLKHLRDHGWLTVLASTNGHRGTEYAASTPTQNLGTPRTSTPPYPESGETPYPESGEENSSRSLQELSIAAKPRARDEIFDAVCSETGTDPSQLTRNAASLIGSFVKSLKSFGATPDEIHYRANAYHRTFPNAVLTVAAFDKHWPNLGNGRSHAAPAEPELTDEERRALWREVGSG